MRRLILIAVIYATHAFAPPYTLPSVTEAAGCVVSVAKYVKPTGSQSVNRRKRKKRVRRVVHRKRAHTRVILSDTVIVITYQEYWAMEQWKRQAATLALWALPMRRWR